MSSIVLILGAGASAECGAPVMSTFLARAQKLAETGKLGHFATDYDNVHIVKNYLFNHQIKAKLDTTNMESLFSAIDMGLTLGKLGSLTVEQVYSARKSFLRLTAAVLERTMPLRFTQDVAKVTSKDPVIALQMPDDYHGSHVPPAGYHELGLLCRQFTSLEVDNAIDIITFNYDIGPEIALTMYGVPFSLSGVDSKSATGCNVRIHKMHGSILWTRGADNTIADHSPSLHTQLQRYCKPEHGFPNQPKPLDLQIVRPLMEGTKGTFEPFLVPPTDDKATQRSKTTETWSQAADALSRADVVNIIGYSIPDTDVFFKCLWAISCSSDHDLRRIFVTDTSPEPVGKIKAMVGEPMQGRVQFLQCSLGHSMMTMWKNYVQTECTWM